MLPSRFFSKILAAVILISSVNFGWCAVSQAPSFRGDGILRTWVGETTLPGIHIDGDSDGLRVSVEGLPDFLHYSLDGTRVNLHGPPRRPGYFPIRVSATNDYGTGSRDYLLTVLPTGWELLHGPVGHRLSITFGGALGFVAADSTFTCLTSPDGRHWSQHFQAEWPENIPPDGYPIAPIEDFVWGGEMFVAVTGAGELLSSPDGCDWVLREDFWSRRFRGVTYGGGQFVAVGERGAIATSANGSVWSLQISGVAEDILHVAYGDGRYIAVGAGGLLLHSPDARNWSVRPAPINRTLHRVGWADGRFVAVGEGLSRIFSVDGWDWVSAGGNEVVGVSYVALAYGNGQFFSLTSHGGYSTSLDGTEWMDVFPSVSRPAGSVAYGDGLFVATDNDGRVLAPAPFDAPTISQTADRISMVEGELFRMQVAATGLITGYLALNLPEGLALDAATGLISGYPTETGSFQVVLGAFSETAPADPLSITLIVYPNDAPLPRIILPEQPILRVAGTGFSYQIQVDDPLGQSSVEVLSLPEGLWYAESTRFIGGNLGSGSYQIPVRVTNAAGSTEATISVEVFPRPWQSIAVGTSEDLRASAAGGGLLLLAGNKGTILTSHDDGVTWQRRETGTTANLRGAAFGDGLFVVVGEGGVILTSPDGANWQRRGAGLAPSLSGVTRGDHGWRAFSASILLRSADGIEWETVALDPSLHFTRMVHGHGLYVGTLWNPFPGHAIAWSEDGITWNRKTLSGMAFTALEATPEGFVALAGNRVFFSRNGCEWSVVAQVTGVTRLSYGNGRMLAVGSTTSLSEDFHRWPVLTSSFSGLGVNPETALAAEGAFLVAGAGGSVFRLANPSPPALLSPSSLAVRQGEFFSFAFEMDSQPTHVALTGVPSGVTFDSSRLILSGRLESVGAHTLVLDSANTNGLQRQNINLTVYPVNGTPPVVTSARAMVVGVGTFLTYQLTGSGFQNVTHPAASSLPKTLFLNPLNQRIDGALYETGEHFVEIAVPNLYGVTSHPLLISVVSNAPGAPRIVSALAAGGTVGEPFSYTVATDLAATNITAIGLPSGLALDAASGMINGTPMQQGVFDVVLKVANDAGDTGAVLRLTVVGGPPVIAAEPDAVTIWDGEIALFRVLLGDPEGATYQWRKDGIPLENRLGISGANAMELSVRAAFGEVGDYDVVVTNTWGEVVSRPVRLHVRQRFAQWLEANALSPTPDPGADPFGSGVSNLLAYLAGIDPRKPDRSRLPRIERAGSQLIFTWTQSTRAAVKVSVEETVDLQVWKQAHTTPERIAIDHEQETWRLVVTDARPSAFYRLLVETGEQND